MPALQPPPPLELPAKAFDEMAPDEKLAFLRPELLRASRLVTYTDALAARQKTLVDELMSAAREPTPRERRSRVLIREAESELGIERAIPDDDAREAQQMRRILLARRLLAQATKNRRDARRYRWRIAMRIAELEEGGES